MNPNLSNRIDMSLRISSNVVLQFNMRKPKFHGFEVVKKFLTSKYDVGTVFLK